MIYGGKFVLLKDINCPAVIVEINMLTNKEMAVMLSDDTVQEKIAEALKKTLVKYFNSR
jgi:N-acetylmuramoyl-L-alanine amidase